MAEATPLPTADPVLAIDDLHVSFATPQGDVHAVRGLSMAIGAGETVGVVGESGSGKSQAMMAAMGLLARNGRATGAVRYRGRDILGLPSRALNDIRGARIGMIFQEPMTSLDPLYRVGSQIAEPLVRHRKMSWSAARAQAVELLRLVGIPEPERRFAAYPHELSGGQRQRVMIAMAIANEPDVLIADEPTTALDVTVQAQIIDLLQDLQARFGMAIVFISHDLGLVRRIAGRVVVMRHGEVVETGPTADVFERPQHPYTRMLVDAEPRGRKTPPPPGAPEVLRAKDVAVEFKLGGGLLRGAPLVIRAVEGVNLSLARGETIGIVGESGSGKSTLGRAAAAPRAVRGRRHDPRPAPRHPRSGRPQGAPAPRPAGLPGPVRLAVAAHDGCRHRRRGACASMRRSSPPPSATASPSRCSRTCRSTRRRAAAIRTSSPAASASASPLPAR